MHKDSIKVDKKLFFIAVGLIIGFIFGATNIIRYGPGSNGMLRQLGQYMAGSAATFG